MDLQIRGRVALVTGASSGLGEAVALSLAAEGVSLAIAARRRDRLDEVVRRARAAGATDARAFEVDLTNPDSVVHLVDDVGKAFGDVDILVLNGGGPKPGAFTKMSLDDWDAGYRAVLRSMLELTYAYVPKMVAREWGRIVALASSSVKQPIPNLTLSNAFRSALVAALKTLSIEVASHGVTVNSIATGRILTERLRELYPDEAALHAAAKAEIPIGRVATSEEFAPMVTFLCSSAASYITGQTIAVDGDLIASAY
ncbi:MAG TPA: SDR family oxidoreductase [Candidatus Tumulicola sp.]